MEVESNLKKPPRWCSSYSSWTCLSLWRVSTSSHRLARAAQRANCLSLMNGSTGRTFCQSMHRIGSLTGSSVAGNIGKHESNAFGFAKICRRLAVHGWFRTNQSGFAPSIIHCTYHFALISAIFQTFSIHISYFQFCFWFTQLLALATSWLRVILRELTLW